MKKYNTNNNLMMVLVIMIVVCCTTMSWVSIVPVQARSVDLDHIVQLCWHPLFKVEGCGGDVSASAWSHSITVGRECCKQGVFSVTEDCWNLIFHLFPEFPSKVKQYCIEQYGAPSPPPLELAPTPA